MPRFSALASLALSTQARLAIADCSVGGFHSSAGGERCWAQGNAFEIECRGKDTGSGCGARVKSDAKFGYGDAAMKITAAPGSGVATVFYISTNGGVRQAGASWNEIDFEIMGGSVAEDGSSTSIWTNYITGSGVEHGGFVNVPFDATAGAHIYTIRTNMTHIQWLADWIPLRTDSIASVPDMIAAIEGSKFQTYASLWGKSNSEPGVGTSEFVEAMGNLEDNKRAFPVMASFEPAKGASPGTISAAPAGGVELLEPSLGDGGGEATTIDGVTTDSHGHIQEYGETYQRGKPVVWSRFSIAATIAAAVFATMVPAAGALMSQWRNQDEFYELSEKLHRLEGLEAGEGQGGFEHHPAQGEGHRPDEGMHTLHS